MKVSGEGWKLPCQMPGYFEPCVDCGWQDECPFENTDLDAHPTLHPSFAKHLKSENDNLQDLKK